MRRSPLRRLLPAAAAAALLAAPALAGKYNRVLSIGDEAPAIGELPTAAGGTASLADGGEGDKSEEKAEAVVLVFTCNHCPVAKAYEQRFNAFVKDYKQKPVRFLAVSVSKQPEDTLEATKEYVKEKDLAFTYAYDESQKSGKAYGVASTPQCFVLGPDRKIRYMGGFDDDPWESGEEPARDLVRDAVDAVLAGEEVAVPEHLAIGCSIEYDE